MQALRRSAPFDLPIKILQFGQGNFMRGFLTGRSTCSTNALA